MKADAEKVVIGAALGGVTESLVCGGTIRDSGITGPSCVIVPERRGGPVVAGTAAHASRIGLGLPWPPEARIALSIGSRRVPVPILWRGLTLRRDGQAEWVLDGARFSFADLLAEHVAQAIADLPSNAKLVLTVPDALSDYSRQRILDGLRKTGRHDVDLLWIPVALALAWLEHFDARELDLGSSSRLLVLHLGPGAVDCTSFRLREEMFEDQRYVVPVRDHGTSAIAADGFDLAQARLERACATHGLAVDTQAQWHALCQSYFWQPEQRPDRSEPMLWYREDRWEPIHAGFLNSSLSPDLPTRPSPGVEDLLKQCGLPVREFDRAVRWDGLIKGLLRSELERGDQDCVGVIVAGFPFESADKLFVRLAETCLAPIGIRGVSDTPRWRALWNAGAGSAAIAQGAASFGVRVQGGLPTYFDVLPKFDVYASTPEGGSWESLVRSSEVKGGNVYRERITGEFALARGQGELEVYLRLHDGERSQIKRSVFHFPKGPMRRMPLDLVVEVRPAGGLAVLEMRPEDPAFLGGTNVYLDYGEMEEVESVPELALGCPPLQAPHTVASDDAQLFNPRVANAITDFLGCEFGGQLYDKRLKALQARIAGAISFRDVPKQSRKELLRIVDIEGMAATERGRRVVATIAERLGRDFELASRVRSRARDKKRQVDRLMSTGGWLFGSVPAVIQVHIRERLETPGEKLTPGLVSAAARTFRSPGDIGVFFRAMVRAGSDRRAIDREKPWLAIQWLYGAKRLLSGRELDPRSLGREQVSQVYYFLFHDLRSWIRDRRLNGFAASLWLLLYLFRYRMIERNFLGPEPGADEPLRKDLVETVENVSRLLRQQSFLSGRRKETALEVLSELREFLDFRGSLNIIEKLAALDDGLGDDAATADREESAEEDEDALREEPSVDLVRMQTNPGVRSGTAKPRIEGEPHDFFEGRATLAAEDPAPSVHAPQSGRPGPSTTVAVGDLAGQARPKGGNVKSDDPAAELARLRAENEALKKAARRGSVSFRVSERGGLSVYGLGRFPVTLYVEQWEMLLRRADDLRAFLDAHRNSLKTEK